MRPRTVLPPLIGVGLALFGLLLLVARPPPGPPGTEQQVRLIELALDTLHEEVAAARAPSTGSFVLFILVLLVPILAGVWVLVRAERSVIGSDETIRTLDRLGLGEWVVRSTLTKQASLPAPQAHDARNHSAQTALRTRSRPRGRRRHRRRRRKRKEIDRPP